VFPRAQTNAGKGVPDLPLYHSLSGGACMAAVLVFEEPSPSDTVQIFAGRTGTCVHSLSSAGACLNAPVSLEGHHVTRKSREPPQDHRRVVNSYYMSTAVAQWGRGSFRARYPSSAPAVLCM